MIDWIIPKRLALHVEPWANLCLDPTDIVDVYPVSEYVTDCDLDAPPEETATYESVRTDEYDRGRVRYFAELYLSGYHLDPLIVDNECTRSQILPIPVLIDGFHRLCGALVVGRKKIPIHYSGRLDVLEWLQGYRRRCPSF